MMLAGVETGTASGIGPHQDTHRAHAKARANNAEEARYSLWWSRRIWICHEIHKSGLPTLKRGPTTQRILSHLIVLCGLPRDTDLRIGGTLAAAIRPPKPPAADGHPSLQHLPPRPGATPKPTERATQPPRCPCESSDCARCRGRWLYSCLRNRNGMLADRRISRWMQARGALLMQCSKDAESPTRVWKAEIVLGLILLCARPRTTKRLQPP